MGRSELFMSARRFIGERHSSVTQLVREMKLNQKNCTDINYEDQLCYYANGILSTNFKYSKLL